MRFFTPLRSVQNDIKERLYQNKFYRALVYCKICLDKDDLPPTASAGVVARTPLRAVTNETRMIIRI